VLFSIPGICIGLLLAFLVFLPVGIKLSDFVIMDVPLSLTGTAIGISVSVGMVMPLAALIGPVQVRVDQPKQQLRLLTQRSFSARFLKLCVMHWTCITTLQMIRE